MYYKKDFFLSLYYNIILSIDIYDVDIYKIREKKKLKEKINI